MFNITEGSSGTTPPTEDTTTPDRVTTVLVTGKEPCL